MKSYFSLLLILFLFLISLRAQWVQTGLYGDNITCFVVSGTNIFAGTYGSGIYLSTDKGINWTQVNIGLTNLQIMCILFNGTSLFAGSLGGVFLSTNNGANWTAVNNGLTSYNVFSLVVSGSNIFAGTFDGGVFLSTNNGANWTRPGFIADYIYALAVSGTYLFAGTEYGGVFRSTNNGITWTHAGVNLPVRTFAVSGANIFAGASGGVYLSTNDGDTWTQVSNGITDVHTVSFAISGSNIFAGTLGGVFLSTNNGANWTAVNNGLTNPQIYSLAVCDNDLFAGAGNAGVWRRPLSEMIPNVSQVSLNAGWNMLSVPLRAQTMTPQALFPLATSAAYGYNNGYTTEDSLKNGSGYWLRYPTASSVPIAGSLPAGSTIPLAAGWNMIGPFANDIPVANITTTPAGIINSSFYGYENGYTTAAILLHGKGYWIRTSQNGVMNTGQ